MPAKKRVGRPRKVGRPKGSKNRRTVRGSGILDDAKNFVNNKWQNFKDRRAQRISERAAQDIGELGGRMAVEFFRQQNPNMP